MKNRQAYHEYFIDDKLDAGMVLSGTEVKALRDGKVSFADAYCLFHKGELFVKSLNIPEYRLGNYYNHLTTRDRKLLLRKKELRKWELKMKEKGYTIIPLRIYFNDKGLAKIEIGLARGKKLHDKRDTIREREMDRDIKRKYGL